MSDSQDFKYVLPIGTVLRNSKKRDAISYTIEPVLDGKPVDKSSRFRMKGSLSPVLGQGGYGITYLASSKIEIGNTSHTVYFAIKEYFEKGVCYRDSGSPVMKYSPPAKDSVEEGLKDFVTEATRLNKICGENKNIVKVNEVFEANNTAYYVMEFLDGGNLRDKVKSSGALSVKDALTYFMPISNAVDYIHNNHKLLHCDIKPDNIMLKVGNDGNEYPVLIDFGVSLHFNSRGTLTSTHNSVGASDGYAPPEQYRGIDKFSPEIDVYALSATLFYLLTGYNPIHAFEISANYIETKLPVSIGEHIRVAIQAGMSKEPKERTHTVKGLSESLRGTSSHINNSNDAEEKGERTKRFIDSRKRKTFGERLREFFTPLPPKTQAPTKEYEDTTEGYEEESSIPQTRPITASPTLITVINEKSLLIFFRGNTYVYGGAFSSMLADELLDRPLGYYPIDKDIYQRQNSSLSRLTHKPITIMEHINKYRYDINKRENYVLYNCLDEFLQLSELDFSRNSAIKIKRLINENQLIAYSQLQEKSEGIVRVNIGDSFVDVENFNDVFEICNMGYKGESCYETTIIKEVTLDVDSVLNYIIEGIYKYRRSFIYDEGTTLLAALPYAIEVKPATIDNAITGEEIIGSVYSIPCKKSVVIATNDSATLFVFLVDPLTNYRRHLKLNVSKYLRHIPKNIKFTIDVDANKRIRFDIQDENDERNYFSTTYRLGEILEDMNTAFTSVTTRQVVTN